MNPMRRSFAPSPTMTTSGSSPLARIEAAHQPEAGVGLIVGELHACFTVLLS
jgi:hypothetical protein